MAKLVGFLLLLALLSMVSGGDVMFYELANFGGQSWSAYHDVLCQNMPDAYNDWASSVNTGGHCIKVYEHRNCRGASAVIEPGTRCHAYLGECGMNGTVTSVGRC